MTFVEVEPLAEYVVRTFTLERVSDFCVCVFTIIPKVCSRSSQEDPYKGRNRKLSASAVVICSCRCLTTV